MGWENNPGAIICSNWKLVMGGVKLQTEQL